MSNWPLVALHLSDGHLPTCSEGPHFLAVFALLQGLADLPRANPTVAYD